MRIKDALGINNKAVEGQDKPGGPDRAKDKAQAVAQSDAQGSTTDRVQLSDRSREMAKASEVLASTPEIRQKKVAEIKERIDNNQYEVDEDKVAEKMIVDFLGELV